MDIIRTVYYIHGPWRAKKFFCCFICVSYGPYTLLQNDSFFTFILERIQTAEINFTDIGAMRQTLITNSAVALHCCKAHSKSIAKMENSTPRKIVTPKNFILKLVTPDYNENFTHYTNFHVHRFSGGLSTNRWNITLLWLFSCPVLSCFFSFTRPARTARPIFAVYGSNNVVLPKDGPFGVRTMSDIIWGKCAPKTYQKGAWIGIFKPN